jgi:hypothetical protein
MNRIPVALFDDRPEAESIRQRLMQAGIAAQVQEELWLQKLWFVSKPAAGVSLEVAADQFDQAEKLLLAWDLGERALPHAVRCPQCHSLRVDYPQFARNSVLTNAAMGFCAELGLVQKEYYCERCHFTWPKEQAAPSRRRAHMAPYYFIEDVEPVAAPPSNAPAP